VPRQCARLDRNGSWCDDSCASHHRIRRAAEKA
jgi:hypothetical protein